MNIMSEIFAEKHAEWLAIFQKQFLRGSSISVGESCFFLERFDL